MPRALKPSAEVEALQRLLNRFTSSKRLKGVAPLRVDGTKGPATNARIRQVKVWLGYVESKQGAAAGAELRARLTHPNRWQAVAHGTERQRKAAVRRGQRARLAERVAWARNRARAAVTGGVRTYDGRPVAAVLVPYLDWARRHGWRGVLASGYRTPAYSESLCLRMCGRPSCPGRCAGRSTNHSQTTLSHAACDVTDYVTFRRLMAECPMHPRLTNHLPIDPVHFSVPGN
jgi:hypothetical protein